MPLRLACRMEHRMTNSESRDGTSPEGQGSGAATGTGLPADFPAELARAGELAGDRKANDMVVLDLRGISTATDYFLVVSGTSDTHVKAVADHIIDELKKEGTRPSHVEGLRAGRWVLIDYIDFVVHVFHPAAREFYQLERLWGDAPMHEISA
jgi:ribosome-associated protein